MARTPAYPRGNPLTESMEFRDRDGVVWLAYIEGGELSPRVESTGVIVLPERHLRFDSPSESRLTSDRPAGSPFLSEARLQYLLDQAQPHLPQAATNGASARALHGLGGRVRERPPFAMESSGAAIGKWSRRLRQTARSGWLTRRLSELLAGAANTTHGVVEAFMGQRPARPVPTARRGF